MTSSINENHPNLAYHCGRLMAVLADLQRFALGNVGSGVVQRYYAAASTTPLLTLGRLIKYSNYHLDKIRSNRIRDKYKKLLEDISVKFERDMPCTLDLEQQTLFALGYYHQMAFFRELLSDSEENMEE